MHRARGSHWCRVGTHAFVKTVQCELLRWMQVSGVSWYDHDGDAYFSLETVLLTRDSVNFATTVDCLCALFHTFAMTYSVFSSIRNIQKSSLFTFFELTCPKKHSVPFHGYRLHESFLLPITPAMSTPAMSTPAISAPPLLRTEA